MKFRPGSNSIDWADEHRRLHQYAHPSGSGPIQQRRDGAAIPSIAVGYLLVGLGIIGARFAARSSGSLQASGHHFTTIFLGIFIEALPSLLLCVLASTVIQCFVSADWLQRASPRAPLPAALLGATLGLFCLPVCACVTVPATRRLLAKGASLPLGIGFLLAAPAVNPVVIVSTWIAFDSDPLFVSGGSG